LATAEPRNPPLDVFQKQFCDSSAENIRLLAPAGSGKTHSLLWRCLSVYRARQGSARFLVVTFTRAARDELRKRLLDPAFAEVRSAIEVATLNAWGYRRLRQNFHSPRLQTTDAERSFCVQNSLQPVWKQHQKIDQAMSTQAFVAGRVVMNLMDLLKSLGFQHRQSLPEIQKHLEAVDGLGLTPILENAFEDLRQAGAPDMEFPKGFAPFIKFWKEACESLIGQALFTLEDQKYGALLDLQDQRGAGKRPVGATRYTHLLIDEFQDVNPLDLALIREIATWHGSALTIVGDDDQAIYEWRGATYRYIVDPKSYFNRDFETFILERNYRCPKNLVQHSQKLIRLNTRRVPKTVTAVATGDAMIETIHTPSFIETLDRVMEVIEEFYEKVRAGDLPKGAKIAIVSRKRAQLIPYQILLASRSIPFCAAEDLQVFLSKAFESLIEVLTVRERSEQRVRSGVIVDDTLKMCDLVKRFPLKRAERQALQRHVAAAAPRTHEDAIQAVEAFTGALKGLNSHGSMAESFGAALRGVLSTDTVSEAIDGLSGNLTGLEKDYGKSHEDIFYTDPPFFYLSQFAASYGDDFGKFIEDLDNAAQQLAQLPGDEDTSTDVWAAPVHLMTALRAKGKEFHSVVLLDVNDGIWPTVHAETDEQKEQERRLFYVAMTRAKERLILSWSDRIGEKLAFRSPYLTEAGLV
jgi:DNA helicase-2/ATP-dependent DNA helicase PcrA